MTTTTDARTIVTETVSAFLAGDAEAFMGHLHDDFEWIPAEHHPFLTRPFRGRADFGEAVAAVATELDDFRFDVERIVGGGETVISQIRYLGTVRRNGRSLDVAAVLIWDVRDGLVIRGQEYADTWQFMHSWNGES